MLHKRRPESGTHVHVSQTIAGLVIGACAATATCRAQSVSLDAAVEQIQTASLANNAAILMLYDLECVTQPARDAGGLKSHINTYAAIGERQVGRDSFRKLFFDELAVRRQTLRAVGPIAWCERVAVQLQALGVAAPSKSATD
jgi:hypothetical protein